MGQGENLAELGVDRSQITAGKSKTVIQRDYVRAETEVYLKVKETV